MDSDFSLGQLFPGAFPDDAGRRLAGVAFDSRTVKPGDVFVALAGSQADGARFIGDAVAKGAVAVVSGEARPDDLDATVAFAKVDDPRLALSLAAAIVHPRQPGTIVAVTGTSGKSSVCRFHPADLSGARARGGQPRYGGDRHLQGVQIRLVDDTRPALPARVSGQAGGRRRHASGDGSLFAWARPAPSRWRQADGGRLPQSRPRPSRLSSERGGVFFPPRCGSGRCCRQARRS